MTARRLYVLLRGLPPDSATANAAHAAQAAPKSDRPAERHLAPVKTLSDIPVAGSLSEAGRFVNSGNDEFGEKYGQAG